MAIDKKSIEEKVVNAIEQLRPFLHADGGDMELVEVKDDATVVVKLLGACSDCSMSMMTLKRSSGLHHPVSLRNGEKFPRTPNCCSMRACTARL